MPRPAIALLMFFLLPTMVLADPAGVTTPDSHAPLGVMGDHTHAKGEWMASYRYMRMDMSGNRDGTDDLSPQEVLGRGFMTTPLDMTTEMHMFGLMYAPGERLTLMAMLPYVEKTMDHVNRMGSRFTTESDDVGDIKLTGLFSLYQAPGIKVHAHGGLSAPTGSIDEKDSIPTPMGPREVRLPYPMQIGSGTWDLLSGLTYNGRDGAWSWGAQASSVIRLEDENDNGYRLGNEGTLTAWGARRFNANASGSLRLAAKRWGNVDGADPQLNPDMVPTADPNRRAGKRIDLGVGVNLLGTTGALRGQRVAIEWLEPLQEELDGPQLKSDGMLMVGWQYAWH